MELLRGGSRFLATGEIRSGCEEEFLGVLDSTGAPLWADLVGRKGDARIEWRASPFHWCLEALRWIDRMYPAALADYELHWIQGLLFGYPAAAIHAYLTRPSESGASSPTSAPSRRVETSPPWRAESAACCTTCTDRPPIPGTSLRCSASLSSPQGRRGVMPERHGVTHTLITNEEPNPVTFRRYRSSSGARRYE